MSNATHSSALQFTVEDMRRFAGEAWGPLGVSIVERWCEFNATYFDGALRPVPLVLTNTLPFGNRVAFCSYNPNTTGRTITLNVPKEHAQLLADNCTLLHEMVHQFLFERGEDAAHLSKGWRREIMRLNKQITGAEIWAGRSVIRRIGGKWPLKYGENSQHRRLLPKPVRYCPDWCEEPLGG
jgi:hypothetical protein